MSNVVQVRYTIATRGLRARYNPFVRVYPSASPRVSGMCIEKCISGEIVDIVVSNVPKKYAILAGYMNQRSVVRDHISCLVHLLP